MSYENKIVDSVIDLLAKSYSPFHVVALLKERLLKEGYVELFESRRQALERGRKYFVTRNGSSLIAFKVPANGKGGIHLALSHTDSPTFKVKPNPVVETVDGTVLNVEPYGGMIDSTWMDRPLSLAGRLLVQEEGKIRSVLFAPDRDLLVIPNLCIHMNRTVNDGMKFNAARDMLPLFSSGKVDFLDFLSQESRVEKGKILSFDLILVNRDKPRKVGYDGEFLSSPKLDDLSSCYSSFEAFLRSEDEREIPLFAAFDNEEVGSRTRQGANSTFLKDTLSRLCAALDMDKKATVASSFALSIDNGHANHPNRPEISDKTTKVLLGKGIALKHSARQSYTTDALSAAVVKSLCRKADVPYQEYTDRSDLLGGSTLGNISNTEVSILSCDIGLPQLAMHSSNELCALKDIEHMERLVETFYRSDVLVGEESIDID